MVTSFLSPYKYAKRELSGKWFIFGAKLECGDKIGPIKEKLIELGYSIESQDEDARKLKILPCEKLFDLANQIGLSTVPIISRDMVSFKFVPFEVFHALNATAYIFKFAFMGKFLQFYRFVRC